MSAKPVQPARREQPNYPCLAALLNKTVKARGLFGTNIEMFGAAMRRRTLKPSRRHRYRRSDEYGGSLANRLRFPMQVYEAVRAVWPAHKPMSVRLLATDWIDGGLAAPVPHGRNAVAHDPEAGGRGCGAQSGEDAGSTGFVCCGTHLERRAGTHRPR